MPSERDDLQEYWLVRRAVRDAIWDVIGSVMAVVIAAVLLAMGVALATQGLTGGSGTAGLLTAAVGLVLVAGGAVLFLREFGLFPFD